MEDYGAGWKKPPKVLRICKKKKVGSKPDSNQPPSSTKDAANKTSQNSNLRKRKNPFVCPSGKRAQSEEEKVTADLGLSRPGKDRVEQSDAGLYGALREVFESCNDTSGSTGHEQALETIDNISILNGSHADSARPDVKTDKAAEEKLALHQSFPCDWSLKNKIRFVSSETFSWCLPLKSVEEARSVDYSVRKSGSEVQRNNIATEKERLHSMCMYWTHPHLPWLNLCPRITDDNRIGPASCTIKDDTILTALQSNWAESFTSLYQQLRADLCPFFYVCTHQFTALFRLSDSVRAVSVNAGCGRAVRQDELTAVVSPTSRGFRESLASEGIDFTMPLNKKYGRKLSTKDKASSEVKENNTEHECDDGEIGEEDQEDEAASRWLDDLGLDKKKYKSLDPAKVKLERESLRQIDNRAESAVLISGYHVQALYNLLLNSRSCVANTGIQAGLPPTLLAPAPFKGATLKCLKVKQGTLRQEVGRDRCVKHSLEIAGPILPSVLHDLVSLLRKTQSTFTATISVQDATSPLNAGNESSDNGSVTDSICHEEHLAKTSLRELQCLPEGFHWTVY